MGKSIIAIAVAMVLLSSCGSQNISGETPNPNANNPSTGQPLRNNSAILEGQSIGSKSASVSDLFKELSVEASELTNFETTKAFGTRISQNTNSMSWIVPIKNTSSAFLCFVQLNDISVKDAQGNVLLVDDISFAFGSVGVYSSSNLYTKSCLAEGEEGYFIGIELDDDIPNLYSKAASISIGSIEAYTDMTPAKQKIIPQSYTVSSGSFTYALEVVVKNEGDLAARFGTFSPYLLLDEQNQPLDWGFLESVEEYELISAGEVKTLEEPISVYNGSAKKIAVWVDFKDNSYEGLSSDLSSLSVSDKLELFEQIQLAKLALLKGF